MVRKRKQTWWILGAIAGVFFLLYALLLAREHRAIRDEVFREIEWHADSAADLILRETSQMGPPEQLFSRLAEPSVRQAFDRLVQTKLGHLGLMKVKLYDARGEIVYSTEDDLIGEFFGEGEGFERALTGVTKARFIGPEDYEAEYGEEPPEVGMTEVYVPVSFAEGDAPAYVFETYRDFTPFKARVDRLTRESSLTLGLLLLFALLLSVGVINVNRRLERRIMVLEELLPICASCKKVRVEGEGGAVPQWVAVEEYFHHRAEVDFTHGICPDCGRRYYGHHYDNIVNRKQQST